MNPNATRKILKWAVLLDMFLLGTGQNCTKTKLHELQFCTEGNFSTKVKQKQKNLFEKTEKKKIK